eukprot:CAMPEP_0204254988 /NCGR_PEP_ID=MMETSP0468-20130131/2923_1 /ASSEMBLY_ACC=CAM_ASM_000383 /TAXON_ID=2969 /ORGANISM="Oxyrrhis marina" /LENGTH=148 /DNA_ID=CAMNT_0051228811 /DNA_START=244 /DNA_END=691 /DNA_ORIENTATION=-
MASGPERHDTAENKLPHERPLNLIHHPTHGEAAEKSSRKRQPAACLNTKIGLVTVSSQLPWPQIVSPALNCRPIAMLVKILLEIIDLRRNLAVVGLNFSDQLLHSPAITARDRLLQLVQLLVVLVDLAALRTLATHQVSCTLRVETCT